MRSAIKVIGAYHFGATLFCVSFCFHLHKHIHIYVFMVSKSQSAFGKKLEMARPRFPQIFRRSEQGNLFRVHYCTVIFGTRYRFSYRMEKDHNIFIVPPLFRRTLTLPYSHKIETLFSSNSFLFNYNQATDMKASTGFD